MSSIKNITLFTFGSMFLKQTVQVSLLIITTRTLEPGLVGDLVILNIIIGFLLAISQLGITASIVNSNELNSINLRKFNGILYFSFISFSFLLIFTSSFFDEILNNEIISNYKYYIVTVLFFKLLYLVPEAKLMKSLDFKCLFFCELFSYLISIAFFMVFINIYEPFIAVITYYFIQSLSVYLISIHKSSTPFLPMFRGCMSVLDIGFSWRFSLYQLISIINVNIDNFFISRYSGRENLAFYSRSYQLFVVPSVLFGQVISKVSFPYLKSKAEHKYIIRYLSFVLILTLSISIPISIFVHSNSLYIVSIVFGQGWEIITEILVSFSYFFFFRIIYKLFEPVILIKKKSKTLLLSSFLYLICLLLSLSLFRYQPLSELSFWVGFSVLIYSISMSCGIRGELLEVIKNNRCSIFQALLFPFFYWALVTITKSLFDDLYLYGTINLLILLVYLSSSLLYFFMKLKNRVVE